MDIEQIRARLTADVGGFQAGMQQASGSLQTMTRVGGETGRGMHMIRGAMVALASQATGTAGPLAHLSGGLLLFGGGSTVLLGVAAAVGAIGIAIHALGAEARDAAKETEQMLKTLVAIGPIGAARGEMIRLSQAMADAQAKLHILRATLGEPEGLFRHPQTQRLQETEREIARIQNELTRAQNGLNAAIEQQQSALDRILHQRQVELDKLNQIGRKSGEIARDWEAMGFALKHVAEQLSLVKEKDIEKTLNLEGMDPGGLGKKLSKGLKGPIEDTNKDIRDLGTSVGRELVLGMIEGMQSMQDVLKRVFLIIVDFALGRFFTSLLAPIGIGHALGGGGAQVGGDIGSVVAPASLTMNVTGLPAATTPFAMERDVQWQRVLRGSIVYARQQGFR